MRVPLLLLTICLIGTGYSFLQFSTTSNCGGNSEALNTVKYLAVIASMGAADSPKHTFRFSEADATQRGYLAEAIPHHRKSGPHYLLSIAPISENDSQPRQLVAVCDKPYSNVPKSFWGSPSTHAVAYSDGSTGLISPAEFAALDRTKFVAVDDLLLPETK